MLTITYDPTNGKTIPDGLIKDWADNIVKTCKEVIDMDITVGSGIMVDAIRLLIMKKRLNYKEVVYQFKEYNLKVDKNGRLPTWPEGFCDIHDNIFEELLGFDDNIVKE